MRQMRLFGYTKKRRVTTTVPAKRTPRFSDLLRRRFTLVKPNRVYVNDITYLPIAEVSNMYLATVIDYYSRQLTGFAIAEHMHTELVEEALTMAHGIRGSLDVAIFHSDHGSVGGFNWSSQHLDDMEVCDATSSGGCGSSGATTDALSGAPAPAT